MKNIIICSDGTWPSLNPAFSYSERKLSKRPFSRNSIELYFF
ncbi:hypothetical protein BY454_11350 [Marinobacter persicus]|uniref:Uncharacterized protein n=1 Tax=Marinobacter persicus TaxID=930118 RepID=A0A2S6G676_9GAMM|nr:hypothetical protein BY455_11350 [Marinobacter persicus]PPK54606.1 hypothetical protein B0H24_101250 [Marinobacter persicus]PPK58032.1 hypothetical protein BY454_11350 [Marinobacter persicus]